MEKTIESAEQIRWDLSVLYADIADPRLDSDLAELTAMAMRFSASYKGKLAESLGGAIRDYSEIEMLSGKINSYLFLRESTDLTNAAIKAKHAAFQRALSAMRGEHLTFFELELVQLSDETLKAFYERDAFVAKHRPWIEHVRTFKRHFLTEPVESALTKRSPFDSGSWSRIFRRGGGGSRFSVSRRQQEPDGNDAPDHGVQRRRRAGRGLEMRQRRLGRPVRKILRADALHGGWSESRGG